MIATSSADSFAAQQPVLHSTLSLPTKLLNRLQPSPETVVLLLAVVIGSGTGLAVVLFHYLIQQIHHLMLEDVMGMIHALGPWTLALIPTIGGLIVGLMRWRWQEFSNTSLLATAQGYQLSPGQATSKAIAASVSLGTGASLGPEGPSVEIGSSIGVVLGQALQVSVERQRLLLGAGAAAGLAAGFNAPIAGVFFALEVILGTTFATSAVSVVLLAAVVAALISQIGLGGQPAFTLPIYEVRSPLELPLYLVLGLFASLVSIAYTQAVQLAQEGFRGDVPGFRCLGKIPTVLKPLVGGVCVGIVALQFPQILGIGYETIEAMLRDVQFSFGLLAALLIVKLTMTAISLGSGLVGGLFAPAMFLGASLGAMYGKMLPSILPMLSESVAAPPAYAMVGMAAVLAASARAPLTAILLLFELTRDYRIILPLMAAVGLSVWLVDRLKPVTRSLSTPQTTGLSLNPEPDQNPELLHKLSVLQVMHREFLLLAGTLSVIQAGLAMTRHQSRIALVVDSEEHLVGILTLQDINRALARWGQYLHLHTAVSEADPTLAALMGQRVADICTEEILYAYEDELVGDALARMAARGLRQLPVVERDDPRRILGLLEEEKIALAGRIATTQEAMRPYLATSSKVESIGHSLTQKKQPDVAQAMPAPGMI